MIAKFISKYAFWILQVIGWGLLGLLVVFAGGYNPDPVKSMEIFLPISVSGMLSTTFLRWILKYKINKYDWGLKKIGLVLLANLAAVFLIGLFIKISGAIHKRDPSFTVKFENHVNDTTTLDSPVFFGGVTIFVVLLSWTFLYYGINFIRDYNKKRIGRLKLKEDIKSAQLKTLKGHINSRFLVASLKSIKKLMLENVDKARAMLTELSDLLRYSLTKNDDTPVSILEELEMVEKYRKIVSIDKNTKFEFYKSMLVETEVYTIPPMLLLNSVVLVTKYSKQKSAEKKELHLQIKEGEDLLIIIKFIGKLETTSETEVMVNSIKQRMLLLYNETGRFTSDFEENSTTLKIKIPYVSNQKRIA